MRTQWGFYLKIITSIIIYVLRKSKQGRKRGREKERKERDGRRETLEERGQGKRQSILM